MRVKFVVNGQRWMEYVWEYQWKQDVKRWKWEYQGTCATVRASHVTSYCAKFVRRC